MDYQAAATIIDRNSGLYDITTNEGRERRRLFFSTQGYICEFAHAHADAATSYRSQP